MTRDWAAYSKSTYNWEPGHEKMLRVTKTSLTSDFSYCPKQYEYKRLQGRKQAETDDMTRGTNVHDAMEQFYIAVRPVYKKAYDLIMKHRKEEAMDILMACITVPEGGYNLDEEPIIKQRLEWEILRLGADPDRFLPVINELEVHAYKDVNFTFNGEDITIPIHFAGSIDRGFETEEGTIALMELKTGKWNGSQFKVRNMRTEMAYYMDLLQKADHPLKDVTHWGWFYPYGYREDVPGSENHVGYEKVNRRYLTSLRTQLNRLVEAYLTKNFVPSPSTGKCGYCQFIGECPAWGEGGDIYWKQPKPRIQKE